MKRLIILFAFTFGLTFSGFAQEKTITLEEKMMNYFQATESQNWDQVIQMLNPKLFNYIPQDIMKQIFTQMERESGMEVKFTDMEILAIQKEMIYADTSYIPVDYSMIMQIKPNPDLYDSPQELVTLRQGFEKNYLGQEIVFDPESGTFLIGIQNTLIAVSKGNQTFLTEYKANDPLLGYLLPKEVIGRLKSGWN